MRLRADPMTDPVDIIGAWVQAISVVVIAASIGFGIGQVFDVSYIAPDKLRKQKGDT